jgi:hypothetical protein
MSNADARANVLHQRDGALRRHVPFASQEIAERDALHQLHHDVSFGRLVAVAGAVAEVVNADDVVVTNHRRCTRLAPKAFERVFLTHQIRMQEFDCDIVADVQTLGAKH